ncbi:MAG TPA: L,D-transpeptidase family protein [Stellaceae bacterium]|jgi:L,D-transpeptidase ErfK/SrfK|nr:L,D-transpeptidase family protein [Stellaceae bacterium]
MPAFRGLGRRRALVSALAIAGLSLAGLSLAGPALADEFPLQPGQTAVGQVRDYMIRRGDTLMTIARQFDIGYTELLAANPGFNDPWDPGVGRHMTIPSAFILPDAPRTGIVINLAERRLYYFPPGGATVETYPVGIGVMGRTTPLSTTRIIAKETDPTWYPPPSIRAERPELPAAIGPGPDDPLGKYALRLGWKNYLIHDTNKPDGVGRNVSHGCIHLYPADIERLFNEVGVGTQVRALEQPAAAAWIGDGLYVEAHPDKQQADQIDMAEQVSRAEPAGLDETVTQAAGQYSATVNRNAVRTAGLQRTGLPVEVAKRAPGAAPVPAPVASLPARTRQPTYDEASRNALDDAVDSAVGSGDDEGPIRSSASYDAAGGSDDGIYDPDVPERR